MTAVGNHHSGPRPGLTFLGTPATAPGPLGPQMLRELTAIRRNPLAFLATMWAEYGDVVQFPIPRPPSYLVNDPSAVRRVLVGNARNYGKRTIQYSSLSLVTGRGLLAADTDQWRRQRPLVQPAFHHEALPRVAAHAQQAVERLIGQWEAQPAGAVIDVDEAMMHAALDVVGHALFGTDLSEDAAQLTSATLDALEVVVARARVPITPPAWVPTSGNRRLARALTSLDGAVVSMLRQRRNRAPAPPAAGFGSDGMQDMLDMLMAATDEHGKHLTPQELRDQAVTFIVAGHETVASALTWALALLAAHPKVQENLAAEAHSVLAGRLPQLGDLEALPYARAVIDETMRLYPPAWLITRNVLGADELAGRAIPAGALIILSPWLLHRHPNIWDDPEAFRPERFLPGGPGRIAPAREGFIPFGAGPRQCIGRDFAYVESVLMLSSIVARFSLEFPDGHRLPAAEPLVTMRPVGGVPLKASIRRKPGSVPA